MFGTHQRLHAQGEGHGGAARNREKRADGQIQRAGKAQAVGAAHLLAQGKQAVAAGDADGRNSSSRKPTPVTSSPAIAGHTALPA